MKLKIHLAPPRKYNIYREQNRIQPKKKKKKKILPFAIMCIVLEVLSAGAKWSKLLVQRKTNTICLWNVKGQVHKSKEGNGGYHRLAEGGNEKVVVKHTKFHISKFYEVLKIYYTTQFLQLVMFYFMLTYVVIPCIKCSHQQKSGIIINSK